MGYAHYLESEEPLKHGLNFEDPGFLGQRLINQPHPCHGFSSALIIRHDFLGGAGDHFWGRGRLIQSLDRDHDEMFVFCFNLPLWDLFLHKAKPRHNENGRSLDSIYPISVMDFYSVAFHGMTSHLIPSDKAVSAFTNLLRTLLAHVFLCPFYIRPPKTNMAIWKVTIINSVYIFFLAWILFLNCHLSFRGTETFPNHALSLSLSLISSSPWNPCVVYFRACI